MTGLRLPGQTLRLPGVACPCGAEDLVVVLPGCTEVRHPVAGLLRREVPARGWCSTEHARAAGWPFLDSPEVAA